MISIAIDGPSGAGKSTVAKILSKELNINYLDTGAMYRALGLYCYEHGYDVNDVNLINSIINDVEVNVDYIDNLQHTYLGDRDVSSEIRQHHISKLASDVSKNHKVRDRMAEMQRSIANKFNIVLDGRDIGSFVLPNATIKFYITASSLVRAKRRQLELKERGEEKDLLELQKEIEDRDYNDSHRDYAPLICCDDAIYLDTSNLSVEEVINKIKEYLKDRKII